uniref:Histidine acid phosphatase n=1 Tax=Solanum tuberosum TaxID=4113 RepID=M1BAX9_SOLTU
MPAFFSFISLAQLLYFQFLNDCSALGNLRLCTLGTKLLLRIQLSAGRYATA